MPRQSASSKHVKRAVAKEPRIVGALAAELKALDELTDANIDTSDIPEVLDWSNASIGKFYRPIKRQVSIRLDADVLGWFTARDKKGYQTRINDALRQFVMAKTAVKKSTPKKRSTASHVASTKSKSKAKKTPKARRGKR